MSAMGVYSLTPPASDSKNVAYGGSNLLSVAAAKGPGPDTVTLIDEGWIPVDRIVVAAPSPGGSIHLHSLSDADALTDNRTVAAAGAAGEYLVLNAPAAVSFPFSPPGANCSKSLYFVEYREPVRWDAGLPTEASYWSPTSPKQLQEVSKADFPAGSVLLHLSCTSSWDPPPPTVRRDALKLPRSSKR